MTSLARNIATFLACLLLLSWSNAASAISIEIIPAAPRYLESVYARITGTLFTEHNIFGAKASMSGTTITVELESDPECCGSAIDLMLGKFPQGTYTVRVPMWGTEGLGYVSKQFTVSAPAKRFEPPVNYTDFWWTPGEPGWSISIVQGPTNVCFVAWLVHGPDGMPLWYVMSVELQGGFGGSKGMGTIYRALGPFFGGPFDPAQVSVDPVGTGSISFWDSMTGYLSYDVDGHRVNKRITRWIVE